MSETKYEVLARMDAAILFFEDSARNLREIKQQWLEAHDEQRDEPPTPTTAYKKPITPRQRLVVNTVIGLQELSGVNPTFDEVVGAVIQQYPAAPEGRRDTRKHDAVRDIRIVIEAGHLVQSYTGVVSLRDANYV